MQGARFDVRENLKETLEKFRQATQKQIDSALPRALNRTVTTVRAEAARRMRPLYPGLRAAVIKRQITYKRATQAQPTAVVTFSGRRFRLWGNFSVRTKTYAHGTGVSPSAKLPPNLMTGGGQPITQADLKRVFLQRSRVQAKPNFWLRVGASRMPIDVVVVRGLAVAFVQEKLADALTPVARARFITALTQELKFRTST